MHRAMVSTKGIVTHPTDAAALVEAMKAPDKVLWVDITSPTPEDLKLLEAFGFHPLSIEDVATTHTAPKLDEYDTYVFQVLMVPINKEREQIDLFEVEIFYFKGTIVTVRDRAWGALDSLWDAVCRDPVRELGKGAQVLYHNIVDRAVDAYWPILTVLEDRVDAIERDVLDGKGGTETLQDLFHLRGTVRQLLRSARSQRESVQRLAVGTVRSLTKETCYQFRDVHDHLLLIHDALDDYRESLGGLRDTHLGVLSNRLNDVMRALTVFSAIMLPLAFVTGLWGMNVKLPFQETAEPYSFWIVLGICATISVSLVLWMNRRGWLRRMG